ncbi:MAG TPA: citrate/2-methylcitrate synthase [Bacteroidales bacterium]|nr:citrate/2-methylcitrate synthase [Bacteroidales bacterium]HPS49492.1 citrate/2-methylcitrate synthase [Bacteroidales bacterium]
MIIDSVLQELAVMAEKSCKIDESLFKQYDVKRGLRNADHTGVLVGLTRVGSVVGYEKIDGILQAIDGKLIYRGIDINDLVHGYQDAGRPGFDETVFLLLFGRLPKKEELSVFSDGLAEMRALPENFNRDMILTMKGKDIMNMLARSILALYTLDEQADDTSISNIVRQSISLIAKFPTIAVYSYHAMRHLIYYDTLTVRYPDKKLTTAENFLYMLKGYEFTDLEAELLDLCLVLHAEHSGGNNSTFTTRVVSSSGTDTYSAIVAAIGSLKGPLHGGANLQVIEMMDNIKSNVKNWANDDEVADYLRRITRKEAHDRSGKIYGFGHAVYTVSDPRALLLKEKARLLSKEKGREDEMALYEAIERIGPEIFYEFKGSKDKLISPNVDFYSGFVYDCLKIPKELYTPLFAISRISGWCAHRLEEMISGRRIIRPAYKTVEPSGSYIPLEER